jgi:23S rRNA (uracil1939-C5)-methyltransferase
VEGRVVLVPYTLPGEKVQIRLQKGIEAELEQVVAPSRERVSPVCSVFTQCGGCSYQHAPYEFEKTAKVEILREQLRRVGKIEYAADIPLIAGPELGYRNRVQLHLKDRRLGYLAAGSHQLVPVSNCPIASPRINQAIQDLERRLTEPKFPHFIHSLELFTNETDIQLNVLETERPVAQWFYKSCGSVVGLDYATAFGTFRISPRSFFQVNRFLLEDLVRLALPEEGGASALDLYAGAGLFALPLAAKFKKVTAVESGTTAARDMQFTAERAEVHIEGVNARVEDYLERANSAPDFVLADPPRAGLGKVVVDHLNRLAPGRLTIISCDPATLARDLAGLKSYRIEGITLIDLFPRTPHLETVVKLARV